MHFGINIKHHFKVFMDGMVLVREIWTLEFCQRFAYGCNCVCQIGGGKEESDILAGKIKKIC